MGISCDDIQQDEPVESAVIAELQDRLDQADRRIAQLTATVDGLTAQVAALTAGQDDDVPAWLMGES